MLESIIVTLFPVSFLIILFGGGALFRRRNIDMDGLPPIDKRLFYLSKYSIVVLWAATVVQAWRINLSCIPVPEPLQVLALCLWLGGFILLLCGRFGMGSSFRIGSPRESTHLKVEGLFRFSRNPMYLGVYSTLLATILYTLNPFLLMVAIFIVAVHHKIVLAEEKYLRGVFGEEYTSYCGRVRRYL